MRGEGEYAAHIKQVFDLARKKYITTPKPQPMSFENYVRTDRGQMRMF